MSSSTVSAAHQRLLALDHCILDRCIHQHPEQNQNQTGGDESLTNDGIYYWLCHDKLSNQLSVSTAGPQPNASVLRLGLQTENINKSKISEDSNVGTKLLHADAFVNIWEFQLDPGKACHYHTHRLPYFFTNLTESTTQSLDQEGKSNIGPAPAKQVQGLTIFVPESELSSHAVKNVGPTTFLQFIVEFKYL